MCVKQWRKFTIKMDAIPANDISKELEAKCAGILQLETPGRSALLLLRHIKDARK